jgi:DNA-binding LytR/AlgR family response regulator
LQPESGPFKFPFAVEGIKKTDCGKLQHFPTEYAILASEGGVLMKFKLILDKNKEETVVVTAHAPSDLTARIEELVLQYTGTDKLPVYTEDEMKLIPFSQIECITVADGKTVAIDTAARRYRVRLRLYEVEALLPGSFIRINKSALVNEKRLERMVATFSGGVDAVLKCGYREYVSRRCFAEIKRRYYK